MSILHYFTEHLLFCLIVIGSFGLILGSFFNVVIYRLPLMMIREWRLQCEEFLKEHPIAANANQKLDLFLPRSHCPHCQTTIKAWQNIPVISFILLRGKCAHCKKAISWRYPLVELITGLLAIYIVWHFGLTFTALFAALFTSLLLILTFIDLDQQLLPDQLTLSLLWLGLLASLFHIFTTPDNAIIGALAGYLSLWVIANSFKLLTKKEGMGYGDFKLFAALGAWLGWQLLPVVILMASFIGAIVGILAILLKKHDHKVPIPFGPFLALAGWIGLLWGQELTSYYLHLLRL